MAHKFMNWSSQTICGRTGYRPRGERSYFGAGSIYVMTPGTKLDIEQESELYFNQFRPCAELVLDLWLHPLCSYALGVGPGCDTLALDSITTPSAVDIWTVRNIPGDDAHQIRTYTATIYREPLEDPRSKLSRRFSLADSTCVGSCLMLSRFLPVRDFPAPHLSRVE